MSGPFPPKRVHSRENPLYKALLRLASSARERRREGATLLDGPHLIEAYAASGGRAKALVASESGLARADIARLFERSPADAHAVLDDRLFEGIAPVATPVGILAVIPTPRPRSPVLGDRDCLLVDGLQDAGNVGSILRSAAAAGLRDVFLSKGTVFAWSPKVLRAGMGAHFRLELHEGADLEAIARAFPGLVVASDPHAPQTIFAADLRGPVAWIVGNEGAGINPALLAAASLRARIPMPGATESLNAAAAAAICLFEAVRQRGGRAAR